MRIPFQYAIAMVLGFSAQPVWAANLIVNGDFSTGDTSGWLADGWQALSWGDGNYVATHNFLRANTSLSQDFLVTTGRTYDVSFGSSGGFYYSGASVTVSVGDYSKFYAVQTGDLSRLGYNHFSFTALSDIETVRFSTDCYGCSTVGIDNVSITPHGYPSDYLNAAAVSAWSTAYTAARHYDPQAEMDKEYNCPFDDTCDIDETDREYRAGQEAQRLNIDAAARASEAIVSETGFKPGLNFDTSKFIIEHGEDIVDGFVSIKDALSHWLGLDDKSISINTISGGSIPLSGSYNAGNYYSINLEAQMDVAEINNLNVGETFVTKFDLGNERYSLAMATITSVIDPPEYGTVSFRIQGFEPAAVPEPEIWITMMAGFLLIGTLIRRDRINNCRFPRKYFDYQ